MRYLVDSGEAIEQLEALRAKGGEFLQIRSELFSSLEDYRGLKEHLDRHYCVVHDDETCLIYDLREMPSRTVRGRQQAERLISDSPNEITSMRERMSPTSTAEDAMRKC